MWTPRALGKLATEFANQLFRQLQRSGYRLLISRLRIGDNFFTIVSRFEPVVFAMIVSFLLSSPHSRFQMALKKLSAPPAGSQPRKPANESGDQLPCQLQ